MLNDLANSPATGKKELNENPIAAEHLVGYGLIEREVPGDYRFAMKALEEYMVASYHVPLSSPNIPEDAKRRHLEVQANVNGIEFALRSLIMVKLREEHGTRWQAEVLESLGEAVAISVEAKGNLTAMAFMEELYFPNLLDVISSRFHSFKGTFSTKSVFKDNKAGAEIARRLSDHRRLTDCANDELYLAATKSISYFRTSLSL